MAGSPDHERTAPALGTQPHRLRRHQYDLTISKNWYAGDVRIQFRADMINAFNHTQWLGDAVANGLDNTCTASLTTCQATTDRFGQIIATRAAREIQLGLKVYW